MAAILKLKDAVGNVYEVPALQGRTAYQYAVAGGYTGTEDEFETKMAQAALSAESAKASAANAADSKKTAVEAANRAELAAARQPYPEPETGTWWAWNAETGRYVDTGADAKGDSGLPDVVSLPGVELTLTLTNNVEYRCTDAVTILEITGFTAGEAGKAELWSIVFTAGETITVTVPESVIWAVAEPVFTAGFTYWITWTPMGDKYLAVWVEVEAEEETDEPADV
mgnify:CR=1 FL=1